MKSPKDFDIENWLPLLLKFKVQTILFVFAKQEIDIYKNVKAQNWECKTETWTFTRHIPVNEADAAWKLKPINQNHQNDTFDGFQTTI